ncbi:MAG: nucleotidyltransferase domain-containing protein [Chlamydiota bacterium]
MVRLNHHEVQTLINATHQCFGQSARIWLYGSRVDDKKKGGDIDLYIETEKKERIVESTLEMRTLIWEVFGDQKIDIIVREISKKMNPMHTIARDTGVDLETI